MYIVEIHHYIMNSYPIHASKSLVKTLEYSSPRFGYVNMRESMWKDRSSMMICPFTDGVRGGAPETNEVMP